MRMIKDGTYKLERCEKFQDIVYKHVTFSHVRNQCMPSSFGILTPDENSSQFINVPYPSPVNIQ